jgi:hypothetical protein
MVKRTLHWFFVKFKLKKIDMTRESLKDGLYGGLSEILKNPRLYYHSIVGPEFCKFTDKGQEEIVKWLEMQAREIVKYEEELLDSRAKELVLKELQK